MKEETKSEETKTVFLSYINQKQKEHSKGINIFELHQKFSDRFKESEVDAYLQYLEEIDFLQETNGRYTITGAGMDFLRKKQPKPARGSTKALRLDKRAVFVVHGRNLRMRDEMFQFLNSIGLTQIEWGVAVSATGKPNPFIGEVLDAAFSKAQAIVVLMTPDDEGRVRKEFRKVDDEHDLSPQARLNVIFEAGMAIGRDQKRTILVEIGKLRPLSDVEGRYLIKLDSTPEKKKNLINSLITAGCTVNTEGSSWLRFGHFDL